MPQRELPVLQHRRLGETIRRGAWWLPNICVVALLSAFVVCAVSRRRRA